MFKCNLIITPARSNNGIKIVAIVYKDSIKKSSISSSERRDKYGSAKSTGQETG